MLVQTAHATEHAGSDSPKTLPFGLPELDRWLPGKGLPRGCVTELRVHGASGAATSLALSACRVAQFAEAESLQAAEPSHSPSHKSCEPNWCAFIDPAGTLFAPGVAQSGVSLERLLIVRPDLDSLERVAIRIAESKSFALLVIDTRTRSSRGRSSLNPRGWQRTVRKLSLLMESRPNSALFITSSESHYTASLPVALRIELRRSNRDHCELQVSKNRSGQVRPIARVPLP